MNVLLYYLEDDHHAYSHDFPSAFLFKNDSMCTGSVLINHDIRCDFRLLVRKFAACIDSDRKCRCDIDVFIVENIPGNKNNSKIKEIHEEIDIRNCSYSFPY